MTDNIKKPTLEDGKEVVEAAKKMLEMMNVDPMNLEYDRNNCMSDMEGLNHLISSMPYDKLPGQVPHQQTAIEEFVFFNEGPSFSQIAAQAKLAAESAPTRKYWNQRRINDWQDKMFNFSTSDLAVVFGKLEEEQRELLEAFRHYSVTKTEVAKKELMNELADNAIMQFHLAGILREELYPYINNKMDVNEERAWTVSKGGSGKHVEK